MLPPPTSFSPPQAKRRVRIRAEKLVDHRFTQLLFSKRASLHDTMLLGETELSAPAAAALSRCANPSFPPSPSRLPPSLPLPPPSSPSSLSSRPTVKRLQDVLELVDADRSGYVTWEYFGRAVLALAPPKLLRADVQVRLGPFYF